MHLFVFSEAWCARKVAVGLVGMRIVDPPVATVTVNRQDRTPSPGPGIVKDVTEVMIGMIVVVKQVHYYPTSAVTSIGSVPT